MNLVAKEYIAAQDPENPGVLVLSGFAGAARELRDALIVDPRNPVAIAKGLRTAIGLPRAIRRSRHARMIARLREYDVHRWQRDFLAALEETRTFVAPKTAAQEGERMPLPENRRGKISRRDVPAQNPQLPSQQDKLFVGN
jgi:trehalose-6-phosphate synthase